MAAIDTAALLDRAERQCRDRGTQLTELRRQVLGLVLDSGKPMGAYELLDQLRGQRRGAAPPTVYRALEFLLEQGLIHKVERLSAFVGCVHATDHAGHDHAHHEGEHAHVAHGPMAHPAQFLICGRCGQVTELDDPEISRALAKAAQRLGFTVTGATVEADGLCAACAALPAETATGATHAH